MVYSSFDNTNPNLRAYLKDNPAVCDEIAEKVREHYGLKADVAAAAEKEE